MRIVYLHGFASSPQSSKARFFAQKFAAAGIPFDAPQLDQGDFERLTITGQLAVVEQAAARTSGQKPAVLMGSSLGGFLVAAYAARHPDTVEKLVLLAPALHFVDRFRARFTAEELEEWRTHGSKLFFHYGSHDQRPLGYSFVEDASQYEQESAFAQPALILHGTEDSVVPAAGSVAFAERHPNARVRLLPSGHELTDVTEELWFETAAFLRLPP